MKVLQMLYGAIAIVLGVVLFPVIGGFIFDSTNVFTNANHTSWVKNNAGNISGIPELVQLVAYGFAFGLVAIGVGMIYLGWKDN